MTRKNFEETLATLVFCIVMGAVCIGLAAALGAPAP
jgi:hypothetical protein